MRDVCIVTGGAGFIGCAISALLMERFRRVVAVDNLHPQIHPQRIRPAALHPGVTLIESDVTRASDWESLLINYKPECVIHLAAETGVGQSLTEASRHAAVNVSGLAVMLDALARANALPARIILTSSRAVYGEGAYRGAGGAVVYPGQRTREQFVAGHWDFKGVEPIPACASLTGPAPVSVYGATKLAQEHVISAWTNAFGVETAILRLQNVYGVGQSLRNPYTGVVQLFCQIAREKKSIPLYEDGQMLRDFILIDDVAEAIIRAVDVERAPEGALDVGTGVPTSIARLAEAIAARYGAPPPHVSGKYRYGDVRHAACRIDATTEQLDWRPRRDLDTGLKDLCDWIETERVS